MNLVNCSKPCAFQKEGYCTANGVAEPVGAEIGGCSFFKSIQPPNFSQNIMIEDTDLTK